MNNYYFTFGSNEKFPYQNGYLIIKADSYGQARSKFEDKFGIVDGVLPFSFQYDQEEWNKIESKYSSYFIGECYEVIE